MVLDRRTGRIVFRDKKADEPLMTVDPYTDPDQRRLELRLFKSIVRLTFTDKPLPE